MKRLIALIGAVATAFGLYADPVEYYANSFETTTEGLSQDGTTWSAATPWSTELTDAFKVEAYGQGEPGVYSDVAARRTTMFQAQDTNLNVLKLETGTNTLDLAIGDVTVDPGKFYFDQLVKFTGFEEEPTFAADTKIAVWMSAIEQEGTPAVPAQGEPEIDNGQGDMIANPDYVPAVPPSADYIQGETNLYVQVGTGTAARKVQIKGSFATETWYRITIKSLGNVIDPSTGSQQAGFLVFINGESAEIVDDNKEYYGVPGNLLPTAKDYYDKGLLFTAIDTTSVTLAKVGYQGIGAIDDVILTSTSPDFDMSDEIEIEIGSFALNGAKVIKIGDVTITDQTSIKVKPGDILVSYAANGPYIVRNGEGVKWTVNPDGTVVMGEGATIQIIEAAAKITRGGVATYYAADELDATIALVQDGDIIDFLKDCTALEEAYVFAEGTRVTVTAKGNWAVKVPADKSITDLIGTLPEKNITITFETPESEKSSFFLAGNIYGNGDSPTKITANGYTMLSGNLTIGATYPGIEGGQSAELKADYIGGIVGGGDLAGDYTITLIGSAKVITMSELTANSFGLASASDLKVEFDEGTGYYTYSLNAAEPTPTPTTGFAIIIADAQAGTSTTNYYESLEAAIAAAGTEGLPSVVTILENVTIENTVLISKAVTLDATGKTVTCAAMYPFFVKGGDLTITGGTFTQNVVDGIILWAKDGGKITVNGGDFSAIPDGEIAYVSTADALIKIYGGKFVMADKADGSKGDVLNVAQTLGLNKTDYIQVYGGSFSKDPAEGDDALGPTFVANGYASVKQDNGLWKVGAAIIATFKVDDAIVKAETNIVAFTPVAPTNPSKEGYTFTGWTPAVDEISKSTVFVAQFKAEETKVDPEQPIPVPAEKTPEQVAEQMNTKGIANYLKVPTVVTDAATYTAMFAAKADGNTVIIALKPTVEAEIKAELANTATSGSMLNPDATTSEVTITARPGLFYGIKAVGDVTTIGTANGQNWVQASGDTVNVVRPTVSGNAAFFQAVCSPKAPPANN